MEEIWKDIEGYEGLYQISSNAKVLLELFWKTMARKIQTKRGGSDMIELNRRYPTARKEHKCMYCCEVINVGDKYERQTNLYDGQIYDWVCHLECQKITGLLNMFDYYNDEGVTTDYFQESICEWLHDHHYNDESDTYDEGFDPDVMSYHEIVLNIIKELESKQ